MTPGAALAAGKCFGCVASLRLAKQAKNRPNSMTGAGAVRGSTAKCRFGRMSVNQSGFKEFFT